MVHSNNNSDKVVIIKFKCYNELSKSSNKCIIIKNAFNDILTNYRLTHKYRDVKKKDNIF